MYTHISVHAYSNMLHKNKNENENTDAGGEKKRNPIRNKNNKKKTIVKHSETL